MDTNQKSEAVTPKNKMGGPRKPQHSLFSIAFGTDKEVFVQFRHPFPKCYPDLKSYRLWFGDAKASRTFLGFGPCSDCQSAFKRRMEGEDRCENRRVQFRVVNGAEEGYVVSRKKAA